MPVKKIKLQIGDVIHKRIIHWNGNCIEQSEVVIIEVENYAVVKREETSDTYVIPSECNVEVPSGRMVNHYNRYLVSRILESV